MSDIFHEEKTCKNILNLALLQGYSCGDNYQSLEDIPALSETPLPPLSEAKRERIEKELLKDFVLKSSDEVGDLSSKVSFPTFFVGDIHKLNQQQ